MKSFRHQALSSTSPSVEEKKKYITHHEFDKDMFIVKELNWKNQQSTRISLLFLEGVMCKLRFKDRIEISPEKKDREKKKNMFQS